MSGAPRPAAAWRKAETPDFDAIRRAIADPSQPDTATSLGRISRRSPGRLQLQPLLCELYRSWARKLDVVLRHEYRAGEKLFIDYAGDKIPIYDPRTGDVDFQASLFVAVLGASSYTFAEATRSQDRYLLDRLPRPRAGVPWRRTGGGGPQTTPRPASSIRAGMSRSSNATYRELAEHYGFAVIPTRPYKPRDKAKAEVGATNGTTLDRSRAAPSEVLPVGRPQPSHRGSCSSGSTTVPSASVHDTQPHPAVRTTGPTGSQTQLPAERYVIAEWKPVSNIDYHVEVERHYYSCVPYQLVSQQFGCPLHGHHGGEIFHLRGYEWHRMPAALSPTPPPRYISTDPRVTRRIWSGPRRA